ncbi:MAG: ribonuclease III domain-containing protein, partial [Candidatus Hydrogenedentota bacterium]
MGDEERERLLKVFMEETGAFFTDMALLDQALTHGSVMNDDPDTTKDYESLEFLGDAALELAISQALYARISAGTPGELTQLRSRIVNKHALAGVARQLNIGRYIRLGKGEELAGGRGVEGGSHALVEFQILPGPEIDLAEGSVGRMVEGLASSLEVVAQ